MTAAKHNANARLRNTLPQAMALACLCFVYVISLASLKATTAYSADDLETLKHIYPLSLETTYSIPETIHSVANRSMEHAPLYFVALNIWQSLAGYDLFTARLLSVYFALLAIALAYRLGGITGDREVACAAAIVLSLYAFFVHYAHVARMYTLLPLLAGWLLWAYWRALNAVGAVGLWRWLWLFVATAGILYTHYFGSLLIAALGCYHLVFARKDRRWLWIALALALACLSFLAWLPVALRGFERSGTVLVDLRLPLLASLQTMLAISANGLWLLPPLAAAAALYRRKQLKCAGSYFLVLASLMVALFLLLNEVTPTLVDQRMRYIIVLALPMCCALAVGLRKLPFWSWLRWLLLALGLASFFAYRGSEALLVYTDLRASNHDLRPHYQTFDYASDQLVGQDQLILSMHERATIKEYDMFRYYRALLADYADVAHIGYQDDGALVIQSRLPAFNSPQAITANSHGIWLLHNPQQTDLAKLEFYRDWFSQHYRSCGNWVESPQALIAYYLKHEIPCQLITDSQPLAVQYDNGTRLGNAVIEETGNGLTVYLWWHETIDKRYSYTLQLFDAAGMKVAQVDAVIADAPIDISRFDLADLPPGDYQLKHIVYDFETLKSQAGLLLADERHFDRELVLHTLAIGD